MAFGSDKAPSSNTRKYLTPQVTQLSLAEAKTKLLAHTSPGDLDRDEMLAKLEQMIKIESKSTESMN
jgi:hypothetical protein